MRDASAVSGDESMSCAIGVGGLIVGALGLKFCRVGSKVVSIGVGGDGVGASGVDPDGLRERSEGSEGGGGGRL